MIKTIFNLSLALALGSCSECLAADNSVRPLRPLERDVSNTRQTKGKETDKATHKVTSTVHGISESNSVKSEKGKNGSGTSLKDSMDELGKNANKATAAFDNSARNMGKQAREQIGKAEHAIESGNNNGKSAAHKGPKTSNDLEKNASAAVNALGKEADKAEHAITGTVHGIEKSSPVKNEKSKNGSGSSLQDSMNELGKNANKAGAAMESSVKSMSKQAGNQIGKAEHAMESNNKGQNRVRP